MSYYKYPHKKLKGYRVISHYCMEVALVNVKIAYSVAFPDKKLTTKKFCLSVIKDLLGGADMAEAGRIILPGKAKHFPAVYENKKYKTDCVVCSDRTSGHRKQVTTYCKHCDKPMYMERCFERFHTVNDYKIKY